MKSEYLLLLVGLYLGILWNYSLAATRESTTHETLGMCIYDSIEAYTISKLHFNRPKLKLY